MNNVDIRIMQRELEKLKAERADGDRNSGGDHTGGNGSGNGGGGELEARVAKLESHVEYMRRDISDLKADVKAIAADIVTLKVTTASAVGKLENIDKHMVTKGQLSMYAFLTLVAVVGAAWWVVQQYLAPILKALPK